MTVASLILVRGRVRAAGVAALLAFLASVAMLPALATPPAGHVADYLASTLVGILLLGLAGGATTMILICAFRGPASALQGGPPDVSDAERRYQAYWRDTGDSLFTVRVLPDGGFMFDGLNPAHEARTGLTNAQIARRRPEEVLPPEVAAAIVARYRRCVETGSPMTYEETLDLPGGRRHWETSLAPVRNAAGQIDLLLGSSRDVSARVQAQAALARSEERLRTVIELVPDILFTAGPDGRPDYVSPRFFAYTGLAPPADPRQILATVHPDDAPRLLPGAGQPRQTPSQNEVRIRARDGSYHWFLVRAVMIGEGDARGWYGLATDIDELKASSQQIVHLNTRLSSVLAAISDCYYTIDRNWRITSINAQAAAWIGRPVAELMASDVRRTGRLRRRLRDGISVALATGAPFHVERASTFYPDRWVEFHVYPSGEGASIFFRDVTERHRTLAETEEAKQLLQGSLDAIGAEVALIDEAGLITAVNQAWRRAPALQGAPRQGLGEPYLEMGRLLAPEMDEAKVARGVRSLLAGRRRSFSQPYVQTTDKGLRWGRLRIDRFRHGATTRLIAMHEDVTEIARAQTALRETTDRLFCVQEEERQRIAVDLHDSTSQHLVAIGLGVSQLRRTMRTQVGAEPVLNDMAGSIGEALKEIRVLSYLLNPPNLDRDGLSATARRFVAGFGARTGLKVAFRAEGPLDGLEPQVQRTIFRVMQEALSNVHRHAAAHRVSVELSVCCGGGVLLRVADDGRGIGEIDTGVEGDAQLGVGIPGMRTRIAQLGGALTISGDGGLGTVVEAHIPGPADRAWGSSPDQAVAH